MPDLTPGAPKSKGLDVRKLACTRLFDEVPCYISVQDRDLTIVDANRRFIDEFGDRIGERCYQVYRGRSERCPECVVARTFDDGKPHSSEETLFDKRGLPRETIVNTQPIRDQAGDIVGVMEVFTDITVTKELQKRLHDSLNRYNSLFEQVPCFITVQDRDLRVSDANALFKENFKAVPGGHCYEMYKRRDKPCEPCPVQQTFADGLVHSSEEVVIDDSGNAINVIVYSSPIFNSRGVVVEVMEVSTDITVVRQLQDRLVNLGQLVAGISHSVKNVLEGLRGGVYIVNLGLRDDDRGKLMDGWEMVERNVGRVSNLIMDLLYCAKDRTPRRLPIELGQVAGEVFELYQQRALDCDVELSLQVEPGLAPILGDPKDLHSMLANLVTNAIDACCSDEDQAKRHLVTMAIGSDDGHVAVTVADNGIGMESGTRDKLFNLFFSTKGAFGTGLGLLVAHKVANEHGGAITVESAPGQGATFVVRLPVEAEVSSENA